MGDNSSLNKRLLWGSLLAFLLVMLAWVVVSSHIRRQHFKAIVNEIASVGEFRRAPVVNYSNTVLWFARNEEKGLGIHEVDLKTLASRQIEQITVVDTGIDYFKLFGWSPKDQYAVLYHEQESVNKTSKLLLMYHGKDSSLYDSLDVHTVVERVIWWNTNSFLFLNDSGDLFLRNLKTVSGSAQPGHQKIARLDGSDTDGTVEVIGLMSEKMLAFVPKNKTNENLWSFDLETKAINRLSFFTNMVFEWPNYNKQNGQILFCWTEPGSDRRHLFLFDLSKTNDLPKQLTFGKEHTFNGQWIQNGAGYAYVGNPGNISYLALRPKDISGKTNLFEKGYIRSYTVSPAGDKIYALAAMGTEPQGIWEYDIAQKALRCIVPGTNAPFVASEIIAPVIGFADSKDGSKIPYYMLPPRDFEVGKKYPAVIDGPCESRWRSHSQLLANLGVYYIAVNRRGLASSDDLSGAAEDILQVYQKLLDNPSIHPKRIFIMGFSYATGVTSQLIEQHPELWRGAVLNSPAGLPRLLDSKKYPPIFISVGDKDPAAPSVTKFEQKNWLRHAIKTVYYPNAGHMLRNVEYTRDRERRVVEFVLK